MKPNNNPNKTYISNGNATLMTNKHHGETFYKLSVEKSEVMHPYIWLTPDELKRVHGILTEAMEKLN